MAYPALSVSHSKPIEAAALITDSDYTQKLVELDLLLNDPDIEVEPARVWCLLAEVSQYDRAGTSQRAI